MKPIIKKLLILALTGPSLFAQTDPAVQLHKAIVLEQQGQIDDSIAATEALTTSRQLTPVDLGRADILLGTLYHQKGRFIDAQATFERALYLLAHDRDDISDYAAALQNYGGLYSDVGQLEVAKAMWTKALHLRQKIGDHAAATRSLVSLAQLSLAQNRTHDANKYLGRASDEMTLASDLTDDDYALIFETRAWLALAEKRASDAVTEFHQALDISLRIKGSQHWLIGFERALLGKAYAQLGDTDKALNEMREGVDILDRTLGHDSPKHMAAQFAYSDVLDKAGYHVQAAQLRAEAKEFVKDFSRSQCVSCTMNVAAFR